MDALYAGLAECAGEYGVTVVGGDVVSAPQTAVTVALIGRANVREGAPLLMRRDGACAGDVIAVTGTLGDSAAGLRRLRDGVTTADALVRAHLRPQPPLSLGREAARAGIVCAIDVSDGLIQDLGHICEASGLGADVRADAVPLSRPVRSTYPAEALALACGGGEDYELVLVGRRDRVEALAEANAGAISIIGEVTGEQRGRVRLLDSAGAEVAVSGGGWDHLTTARREA
jgi:thiamine-monophosphate kinase